MVISSNICHSPLFPATDADVILLPHAGPVFLYLSAIEHAVS